ncbi:MAG: ATP-binding protein [Pseudomonadota bacterium]
MKYLLKKHIQFLVILIVAIIIASLIPIIKLSQAKTQIYDKYVRDVAQKQLYPDITIVGISDNFFKQAENQKWPIELRYIRMFLENLLKFKPKIIAFDFPILANSQDDKDALFVIKNLGSNFPNIIVPGELRGVYYQQSDLQLSSYDNEVVNKFAVFDNTSPGKCNYLRKIIGKIETNNREFTSLPLEITNVFLGKDLIFENRFTGDYHINYLAPGSFPSINFTEILSQEFDSTLVTGKILIIGRTDSKDVEHFYCTPFNDIQDSTSWMSRVEIVANIVNTILGKTEIFFLGNYQLPILLSILSSVALITITYFLSPLFILILTLSLFIILCLIFFIISYHFNMYFDPLSIIISFITISFLGLFCRFYKEYKKSFNLKLTIQSNDEIEVLRKNFLSLISHDLKSPISRIQSISYEIIQKSNDSTEYSSLAKKIIQSSENLSNYVTKLINLTKIESEKVKINKESADITKIIEEAILQLDYHSSTKGISIKLIKAPIFPIRVDRELIKEVVSNLIENGIKYSPPNTEIEIKVIEDGAYLIISIKDQGYGIPGEMKNKIFEKFFRIDDERSKLAKGSGIGLYLTKYFIELHHGKLSFESNPTDGTQFFIKLPKDIN